MSGPFLLPSIQTFFKSKVYESVLPKERISKAPVNPMPSNAHWIYIPLDTKLLYDLDSKIWIANIFNNPVVPKLGSNFKWKYLHDFYESNNQEIKIYLPNRLSSASIRLYKVPYTSSTKLEVDGLEIPKAPDSFAISYDKNISSRFSQHLLLLVADCQFKIHLRLGSTIYSTNLYSETMPLKSKLSQGV